MKNDNLRADRDELDIYTPRTQNKRSSGLVWQIALGVFLGGMALWLVQLVATSLAAKFMLGTLTIG
ncbi:hypothetical protein [Pseudomonas fluorescens]|uniref:Uncharacterized protein n=1 Tax=Pseudomonas fluorescens TaxID=294 RepID=A0A5E7FFG3_PSEFL|nr:hypothetical protein [Pseudomonas fluorescens]VVO38198.1 hypothetical protein PS723_05567 [Pseudomonas fluorescens]